MTTETTCDARTGDLHRLPAAVRGALRGQLRPRPVDQRLLASIRDAGFPDGDQTVRVRALPQHPRVIPLCAAVEGASPLRTVRNSMTTFVVEHPQATFLVDPAYCRDARERVLPELSYLLRRVVTPPIETVSTADSMRSAGVIADFAVPTHAHWDHVAGLLDLPGLPVYLRDTERDWVVKPDSPPVGGVLSALTDGRPVVGFELDGPPVATFPSSHDLFGDGAVLFVELSGHTPGNIGVLMRTAAGRVLIAGDAAWHYEQIERVRQKSAFPGLLVDEDRDEAFRALHRLHVARHLMRIVPSHDHDRAHGL